ncbi:MAG: hypothetical protein JRH08_08625 [Deltaproteobacteria bacterium]|nr:hypothetical protein [Deltaproteobacteria bacterium]MBW2125744.1 hypothetical protein [Deltaproteobacteria bacterium]
MSQEQFVKGIPFEAVLFGKGGKASLLDEEKVILPPLLLKNGKIGR